MRNYELVTLLHPDLEIDLDKPLKKIEKIIKDNKGKVAAKDSWGKRKLAYPIAKQDFAVYIYFELQLIPQSVGKIDAVLNITDEVLRHLITNPVPKPKPKDAEEPDKKPDKTGKSTKKTDKLSKTEANKSKEGE